ncbi:MAG: septum site-determining protein MinD [Syntrophomonadaceae bacterium]|jgi:septum site-determining protein MinD|nr:septum site-determining protein MinD [Syntrophomonadaceae bacterium]
MKSQVLVITSGKGGVGKTTTTANLGTALAMMNHKVVLVDTDLGLRNLDVVMGLENRIVFDIVDVVNGNCKIKQALIRDKRFEGLCLLPAAQTKDKTAITPHQMKNLTNELRKEFDFILVDCPAGIEQGFKNAIAGADNAVVVATPEVSSVRDADRIVGLLEAAGLLGARLIINRLRTKMVKHGDMMDIDDILDILSIELLGVVPEDESIIVSTNRGEPAVLENNSPAGAAYKRIAHRITGEYLPIPVYDSNTENFIDRFRRILRLAK